MKNKFFIVLVSRLRDSSAGLPLITLRVGRLVYSLVFLVCCLWSLPVFAGTIPERFGGKDTLRYKVYYGGMYSGYVQWKYLGVQTLAGKPTEALSIISDTKIMAFLELDSDETIYLDAATFLPAKVVRKVNVFGSKEDITETYDQSAGTVTIDKTVNKKPSRQVLKQEPPVRHMLSALYFFPPDVSLEPGSKFVFNLPTRKVNVEVRPARKLPGKIKNPPACYYITGRGEKNFNLWLDKQKMVPIRLEIPLALGTIVIIKED